MRKRTARGWEKEGKPLLGLWVFLSVEPGGGLNSLAKGGPGHSHMQLEQYTLGIKPSIVGRCL